MASDPILAVGEDIDEQIIEFCEHNSTLEPEEVVRDIARIVCIANLVRNGTLDGERMVLCGGMAMRCLESPRMSVYDGDTASRVPPDVDDMRDAISYAEPDIAITAGPWQAGKDLITFQPIKYNARFSELPAALDEFSLSISHRGVELPAERATLRHRYPFPVLTEDIDVPIMHPDEILAEKVVAWWMFGHAKHYNDVSFLGFRLMNAGRADLDTLVRARVRSVIERKLEVNQSVSAGHAKRVAALTTPERRRRLEQPDEHVDPDRDFDTLSYLHGTRPSATSVKTGIDRIILPLLFD
jgi:hypothetical protein